MASPLPVISVTPSSPTRVHHPFFTRLAKHSCLSQGMRSRVFSSLTIDPEESKKLKEIFAHSFWAYYENRFDEASQYNEEGIKQITREKLLPKRTCRNASQFFVLQALNHIALNDAELKATLNLIILMDNKQPQSIPAKITVWALIEKARWYLRALIPNIDKSDDCSDLALSIIGPYGSNKMRAEICINRGLACGMKKKFRQCEFWLSEAKTWNSHHPIFARLTRPERQL